MQPAAAQLHIRYRLPSHEDLPLYKHQIPIGYCSTTYHNGFSLPTHPSQRRPTAPFSQTQKPPQNGDIQQAAVLLWEHNTNRLFPSHEPKITSKMLCTCDPDYACLLGCLSLCLLIPCILSCSHCRRTSEASCMASYSSQ
jgi:hypothetical protein